VENVHEKFAIHMNDSGVVVEDNQGQRLVFSAHEALMLLDILRNEEAELNRLAEEASPLPVKIHL